MLKSFSMAVLLTASAPVLAGTPPTADARAKDPKRKICEAVEETGSRLSSKRICMTAEQWEAQRGGDRGKRPEKASGAAGGK